MFVYVFNTFFFISFDFVIKGFQDGEQKMNILYLSYLIEYFLL